MKPSLIIIGAGGHAKSVIDAAEENFSIMGLLSDDPAAHGQSTCGFKILGDDSLLPRLAADGAKMFVVGVGSVGDARSRQKLFELGKMANLEPAVIIHPRAIVSKHAKIGAGSVILAGATVNAGATVGQNVIVNSGAIVEHDCILEDDVHVASGAVLGGNVTIRQAAHVGAGSTIRQGQTVGRRTIVGAGAVVVDDLGDDKVFVGIPVKELIKPNSAAKRDLRI